MDAWWISFEQMCEKNKREDEERRRRLEAAAAYERHVAEYERYMAAYERYEAKAAEVAELEAAAEREAIAAEEREAAAAVEREAEAERERAAAEAEEDAAEKYKQSAMVTVFFDSSKAFSFGFLNESSVLPKINAVLPQFDAVLLQFRDLGLEIVLPQISDLGFAVSPKIGNSVLSGGVLADSGGDSAIDGVGRPSRKPPDAFFCSSELCFLAVDSWRPVLCPLWKPPDIYLYSGNHGFLINESCKMVTARRPPAKPPDFGMGWDMVAEAPDTENKSEGTCVCVSSQSEGRGLDPSPTRAGQAQTARIGKKLGLAPVLIWFWSPFPFLFCFVCFLSISCWV